MGAQEPCVSEQLELLRRSISQLADTGAPVPPQFCAGCSRDDFYVRMLRVYGGGRKVPTTRSLAMPEFTPGRCKQPPPISVVENEGVADIVGKKTGREVIVRDGKAWTFVFTGDSLPRN